MKTLLFLLQKEFIQIGRDKTILLLLIIITVILLFILPRSAKINLGQVPLSVVDHDRTKTSSVFLQKLTGTDCFVVATYLDSYAEALDEMEKNRAEGIIEIPKGFEEKLTNGGKASLFIEIDAVNGVLAGLSSHYLIQIIQQYMWELINGIGYQPGFTLESQEELMAKAQQEAAPSAGLMAAYAQMTQGNNRQGPQLPVQASPAPVKVEIPVLEKVKEAEFSMVELTTDKRYNPDGESKKYQIGAIVAVLVCLVGTVLPALNVVNEKESGTIEQMNVSPVRKSLFILSKMVPSWVIGLIILTLGLIISWWMYGVVPESSYGGIYLISFLFLITMVGFGLLLSTACQNQQQVMLLCFFFLLIICLLCGIWSPIDSMPIWARFVADINPLRYYVEAIRLLFAYGSKVSDLLPYIWAQCVFMVIFNALAIWNFRKSR